MANIEKIDSQCQLNLYTATPSKLATRKAGASEDFMVSKIAGSTFASAARESTEVDYKRSLLTSPSAARHKIESAPWYTMTTLHDCVMGMSFEGLQGSSDPDLNSMDKTCPLLSFPDAKLKALSSGTVAYNTPNRKEEHKWILSSTDDFVHLFNTGKESECSYLGEMMLISRNGGSLTRNLNQVEKMEDRQMNCGDETPSSVAMILGESLLRGAKNDSVVPNLSRVGKGTTDLISLDEQKDLPPLATPIKRSHNGVKRGRITSHVMRRSFAS